MPAVPWPASMKARTATIGHDGYVAIGAKYQANAGSAQSARTSCRRTCATHPRIGQFQASLVHRYYTPKVGQFLSVDPTVLRTVQAYAFANDDPVNESDPSGQCFSCNSLELLNSAYSTASTYLALAGLLTLGLGAITGIADLPALIETVEAFSVESDLISALSAPLSYQESNGASGTSAESGGLAAIAASHSNTKIVHNIGQIGGALATGYGIYQSAQTPCSS